MGMCECVQVWVCDLGGRVTADSVWQHKLGLD